MCKQPLNEDMQIFCHKVAPKFVDKYKKLIKYLKKKEAKTHYNPAK